MTVDEPYLDWEPTLAAIAATPANTFIIGGMDVGKTTFTRLLVNRLTAQGRRVGVLDTDLGQSEIGPPTCVGLAFADSPVQALSDLPPHALAFVGATSPPGYLLEHASAVRRLADRAAPHLLIVDTGGFVEGPVARRLCQVEFDLLHPAHVVALQRTGELEPILIPIRRREDCVIHRLPVPAVIGKKPTNFRTQRRAMRFAAYFDASVLHTFSLDEVALVGTWLGTGPAVAPHLLRFLNQTLGPQVRAYYAETAGRHLGMMVNQAVALDSPELGMVRQQMKASSLSITIAPRLKHLLIGLESGNGKLLGLGLLEAIDFKRRTLGVLTPVRAPHAAHILHMGRLRIAPNGAEVGTLSPNEL